MREPVDHGSDVVIPVSAERSYDVVIGRGLLGHLPRMLEGAARVAVIHPGALVRSAEVLRDDLTDLVLERLDHALSHPSLTLPAGHLLLVLHPILLPLCLEVK